MLGLNKSHLGERIKEERKRLKLSQEEAGKVCGVARETFGKYERGIFEMGAAAFRAFVAAGADPDYIVTGIRREAFEASVAKTLAEDEAKLLEAFRQLDPQKRGVVMRLTVDLAQPEVKKSATGGAS